MWAALSGASSWFVTIGLGALLLALLVGGVVLLILGLRDLARDARRHLHSVKADKNQHASV
jgi:hypothetical protein